MRGVVLARFRGGVGVGLARDPSNSGHSFSLKFVSA